MGILRTDTISGLETPTPVTGSVSFDGNGDYLSVGSVGNWNFLHNGLTDWTVEFWARSGTATAQFSWGTAGSSSHTGFHFQIMSLSDGQGNGQGLYAQASRGSAGNYRYWGANNCLSLNTWHHIAAVFKSSSKTLALYVDGREVDNDTGTANGTFATTDYSSSDSTYALRIGENPGGTEDYNGYISNLRILKGTALYTSNFTPPTRELQPIGDTVLLCCNNPDSAGAEATGKTITVNGDAVASTFSPGLTRDFTYGTQFDGVSRFDTQGYFVPPSGTTEQRSRGRGLFAVNAVIDYIQIQSQGNAIDFGDMSASAANGSGLGSSTRGVFGGFGSPIINTIEYITFSATSNSLDFGDLTTNRWGTGSTSNSTRGIFYAGYDPVATANVTRIDYITIATLGSAAAFGDATTASRTIGGCGSSTRGIFTGGVGGTYQEIEYITLSTLGNSVTFGNLSQARFGAAAASSSTRAIFSGGYESPGPALTNLIDYVTIATTGNAQDFGDLTRANWNVSGTSNSIRGVVAGGYVAPANNNTIDYVTIASTGNAQDFGDMTSPKSAYAAFSDSHGGLS